jgi:hypothetical protein
MNAGSTACEFARSPSHMSRNRQAKTSLISGRRQRDPGDLGLAMVPAERVVDEQPDDHERRGERDRPDRERCSPFPPELRHVHLRAGEEGQEDSGEGADEGEPARNIDVQGVAGDDTGESSIRATDSPSSTETIDASRIVVARTAATARSLISTSRGVDQG